MQSLEGKQKKKTDGEKPPEQSTGGRKVVFIYNTHNTESYLPFLKGEADPDRAIHSKANVTLVSDMLANAMKSQGVGAMVDKTDFQANLRKKAGPMPVPMMNQGQSSKRRWPRTKTCSILSIFTGIRNGRKRQPRLSKEKAMHALRLCSARRASNFESNLKLAKEPA